MRQGAVESRLGAAGNHDLGVAGCNRAVRRQDRVEPGAALAVDGRRRHAVGKAGCECDKPRGVAPLRSVADDDLVDPVGIDTGIAQSRRHDGSAQFLDAAAFVQAANTAKRATPRRDYVCKR